MNESKECHICSYFYFLNKSFKLQTYVCNSCHYLLMMLVNLDNVAILNMNGVNYRCILSGIRKSEAVNLLQNANLSEKKINLNKNVNYENINQNVKI